MFSPDICTFLLSLNDNRNKQTNKQKKHKKKAQMFSHECKKANQKLVQSDEWP